MKRYISHNHYVQQNQIVEIYYTYGWSYPGSQGNSDLQYSEWGIPSPEAFNEVNIVEVNRFVYIHSHATYDYSLDEDKLITLIENIPIFTVYAKNGYGHALKWPNSYGDLKDEEYVKIYGYLPYYR